MLETDSGQEEIIKDAYANSLVVTVGDATTDKLLKMGLVPFLQIVDGQEKRIKRNIPESESIITNLECQNPSERFHKRAFLLLKIHLN